MENKTRQFALTRLSTLLEIPETDTICINLEKCILNYATDRSNDLGQEPAWDNYRFSDIYKQKFLQIQHNLRNSPVLRGWLVNKKIKTKDVMDMRNKIISDLEMHLAEGKPAESFIEKYKI